MKLKDYLGVSLIGALAWTSYQWGYGQGADAAKFSRIAASNRLQACMAVVREGM